MSTGTPLSNDFQSWKIPKAEFVKMLTKEISHSKLKQIVGNAPQGSICRDRDYWICRKEHPNSQKHVDAHLRMGFKT